MRLFLYKNLGGPSEAIVSEPTGGALGESSSRRRFLQQAAAAIASVPVANLIGGSRAEAAETITYNRTFEVPTIPDGQGGVDTVGTSTKQWFLNHFGVTNQTSVGYVDIPMESLGNVTSVKLVSRPQGPTPTTPSAGDVMAVGVDDGNGRFTFDQDHDLAPGTYGVWMEYDPNSLDDRYYAEGDDQAEFDPEGNFEQGALTSYNGFTYNIHVVPQAFELGTTDRSNPPVNPTDEFQPDLTVNGRGQNASGGRVNIKSKRGSSTARIGVGNDGNVDDSIALQGRTGRRGKTKTVYKGASGNITAGVRTGSQEFELVPGQEAAIIAQTKQLRKGRLRRKNVDVNALRVTSQGDSSADAMTVKTLFKNKK